MRWLPAGALAASLPLIHGCSSVPPLEKATAGIPMHDIVVRVKCELADAFAERLARPDFHWMSDWTIKADLTLIANESAAVMPSGTFTQFHRSAINKDAGPTSVGGKTLGLVTQFFSFGANASYAETATRSELVSFSLSLRELIRWRNTQPGYRALCNPGSARELAGNLGLQEWVDSALAPVEGPRPDLEAGNHPAPNLPKSGAPPGAKGGPASLIEPTTWAKLHEQATLMFGSLQDFVVNNSCVPQGQAYLAAQRSFFSYYDKWYPVATAYYKRQMDDYYTKFSKLRTVSTDFSKALDSHTAIEKIAADASLTSDSDRFDHAKPYYTSLKLYDRETRSNCVYNLKNVNWSSVKFQDLNPPIDSLSHSVQFVVVYGVGASPSWSLLQWKGPAANGPLASLGGGRTHILNLAMGSASEERSRALQTLTLQQIGTH
jgi:hypothetical protein